jgi:hypothetical protein
MKPTEAVLVLLLRVQASLHGTRVCLPTQVLCTREREREREKERKRERNTHTNTHTPSNLPPCDLTAHAPESEYLRSRAAVTKRRRRIHACQKRRRIHACGSVKSAEMPRRRPAFSRPWRRRGERARALPPPRLARQTHTPSSQPSGEA